MILRRVVEQLKHQHWAAIAIDLVIVVLGVFIGMQVSNWNEERETRQRAAVFSERRFSRGPIEAASDDERARPAGTQRAEEQREDP